MVMEHNGTMTVLANTKENPHSQCVDWKKAEWAFSYLPPYIWVIFVLGFIENVFVISVFVLHKSRCTVTEIYLGNMAAADLILVSRHPFRAIYISNKFHWPFGGFMCAAVSFLFWLNLYSSIYFLMMVSIERYLALVKAMTIGRLRNPWWAKVNCGIIWIFAAMLSAPNMVFRKVVFMENLNTTYCDVIAPPRLFIVSNIFINVLGFLLPLVVTSFCTFHMISFLRSNSMQQFKKVNKERKATRLVLTVFLVFVMCWLPLNITTFIHTLHYLNVFIPCTVSVIVDNFVYVISLSIAYSNSCINPIIYSMLGNQFRQKAREVYSRLLCKGPDRRML